MTHRRSDGTVEFDQGCIAPGAHGALRMAISLAHEAAQVSVAQDANGITPDELAELTLLWREATGGAPLDPAMARRATDLAGDIVGAPVRPPSG